MQNPPITVLMTIYNGGRYLKPALESVLSQTFREFEFLVIDDCSKDDSRDVVRSFHDRRITLHCNEKNLGQTASLNVGLRMARGEWIARIDADDLAFSGWLGQQFSLAQKKPEAIVLSAGAVVIDRGNRIVRKLSAPCSFRDMVSRSLIASPVNHGGCFMKKQVILESGGYDESLKVVADYDLWNRLIRQGKTFACQPETVMAIRFHEQSVSAKEDNGLAVEETCRVIQSEINALTTMSVSADEAHQIWQLCYRPETIDHESFVRAENLLGRVFDTMKPEWGMPGGQHLIKRKKFVALYVKRMFFLVEQDEIQNARMLSCRFRERYGPHGLIYMLPRAVFVRGHQWRSLYNFMARKRAQVELKALTIR